MTGDEGSVGEQATRAIEMIETQLGELRSLITIYIRPGRNVEPLDFRSARERFVQWRSRTSALLSQQIGSSVGEDFERRVDRAAGFARSPVLEMLEQMDMAQQFLEVLRGRLGHDPEAILSA